MQLYKKETLAQVFCCEFCQISKNTFFTEQLWTTAFECQIHPEIWLVVSSVDIIPNIQFLNIIYWQDNNLEPGYS